MAVTTAITVLVTRAWGWDLVAGIVFGLCLSVTSTVALLRGLADRGAIDTTHGHIALGWSVVQDVVTVIVLMLLPVVAAVTNPAAGGVNVADLATTLGLALARVIALALLMFLVGTRVVPRVLIEVAKTGSRELFTLAVLAVALGIALGSATLFSVSIALGAFLAGATVAESDISHHAAAEALPLRDAFAVLFFVSVGMLFDPAFVLAQPLAVLATIAVITLANAAAAAAFVVGFGYPLRVALNVGVGIAQIAEFAFVLSSLARDLDLMPREASDLVIAGSLGSIALNPLLFRAAEALEPALARRGIVRLLRRGGIGAPLAAPRDPAGRRHVVICGYGRVGSVVAETVSRRNLAYVVIEQDRRIVEDLRRRGIAVVYGDAGDPVTLERAALGHAVVLVAAIADPIATRRAVEHGRRLNPDLYVVARTHTESEWRTLRAAGADLAIWGERELAIEMAGQTLRRYGVTPQEIAAITRGLRRL
jgi:CPA2 family monovalent cation:H+ antiporter-2